MPFAYSDEQTAFAEAVTDTLRRCCPMTVVRASTEEPETWRDVWQELIRLDLTGMLVPECLGGLGLTSVDLISVVEAAGHFCAPVPLVSTVGAFIPLLLEAGPEDEAAAAVIQRVVAGAAATAVPPSLGPHGPSLPQLRGRRLTGCCDGIPDASRVELLAVMAMEEGGAPVLIVGEASQLGLRSLPAMDLTTPLGRIDVCDHHIGDALVFRGSVGAAWAIAYVAAAAELVGLATELVSVSVAHARDRSQFGRPIGSFQGVKHQLADAHLAVERARSLTMYAAALCARTEDVSEVSVRRAAHHAKAAAATAGSTAARVGVQVHGGLGITREHDVSLMYLRARQLSALFGGSDSHYAHAAALGGVVENRRSPTGIAAG